MFRLVRAESEKEYEQARRLFEAYGDSLDFDLEFQGFQKELAEFPGEYAPPGGCVLLVCKGESVFGCIALREMETGICEMKRLYVEPEHRGMSAGKMLVERLIQEARDLGYKRMRLDTVPSMSSARALYISTGFRNIEAYRHNPVVGTTYMELDLER